MLDQQSMPCMPERMQTSVHREDEAERACLQSDRRRTSRQKTPPRRAPTRAGLHRQRPPPKGVPALPLHRTAPACLDDPRRRCHVRNLHPTHVWCRGLQ